MPIKLVGHRGLPAYFPENSLQGIEKAIQAGADAIELDLQFSCDGVPFMLHDAGLSRVTAVSDSAKEELPSESYPVAPTEAGKASFAAPVTAQPNNVMPSIAKLSAAELKKISVHEPVRFGQAFYTCYCPPLTAVVPLLQKYPAIKAFVEIKTESFAWFDKRCCVDAVLAVLMPVLEQVVVISFDSECLGLVRRRSSLAIGLVLRVYDQHHQKLAERLSPEYLICNHKKLCDSGLWRVLWPGPWQWFIYDVIDAEMALNLQELGAEWIESWDVERLVLDLNGAS